MRISDLATLNKLSIAASSFLITADTARSTNAKIKVSDLFPTLSNAIEGAGVGIVSPVKNKNEYTFSKIKSGDDRINVTGGGGVNDVEISLGTLTFSDIAGTVMDGQWGSKLPATGLEGIVPVANGGTGVGVTAYCDLNVNTTGTLTPSRGGTGKSTYTINGILYASTATTLEQLPVAGADGKILISRNGLTPVWAGIASAGGSITVTETAGGIDLAVATLPSLAADLTFTNAGDRTIKIADKAAGGRNLTLQAGTSTGSNAGGDLLIEGGDSGAAAADPGDVTIQTGLVADPSTNPGMVSIKVGSTVGGHQEVIRVTGSHKSVGHLPSVTVASGTPATGTTKGLMYIHQGEATGALPCMYIQQDDQDQEFLRFEGTTAADQTKSLTTDTSVGSLTGHIRVNINGTDFWIPYYATN